MRVIYSGATLCNFRTLQRLALIADEIAFLDRPSITIGNFGTIGRDSEARRFDTTGVPINIHTLDPIFRPTADLFRAYFAVDAANPHFVGTVLEGLRLNETFRNRFISDEANYGKAGKGIEVTNRLTADPEVVRLSMRDQIGKRPPFEMDTAEGRAETLRTVVADASFEVTNALLQAQQTGLAPVSDDPYFCRLMGMRSLEAEYVRKVPRASPALAVAIAQSVVPDEMLSKLSLKEIFEYREQSKDAHDAWTVEVDRLATRLEDIAPENAEAEIRKIIATDVKPNLVQYRNEMISTRDKMFGELLKKVAAWEVPTASIAYLIGMDPTAALVAFATACAPAIPAMVDFVAAREDARRRNSMGYLIGIAKD